MTFLYVIVWVVIFVVIIVFASYTMLKEEEKHYEKGCR